MTTLLDRRQNGQRTAAGPDRTPTLPAVRHRQLPAAEAAARIVDHSFHFAALLLRAGAYTLLAMFAERFPFASHLLAGLLCGDFAASLWLALRNLRWAPEATVAELVLLAGLFLFWWRSYAWPVTNEDKALFFLAGFGIVAPRLLLLGGNSGESGWD